MELVSVEEWTGKPATDYRQSLEHGNIVFFRQTPFNFPEDAKTALRSLGFPETAFHKNIAYRPMKDALSGVNSDDGKAAGTLLEILRKYSQEVVRFTSQLLPEYAKKWKLDYASFRPFEEKTRSLSLTKRNDLIHTDAFPTRPTNGDLILRVFTNIHPVNERVWTAADSFQQVAERFAREAEIEKIAVQGASPLGWLQNRVTCALKAAGAPVVCRSSYDRFMLHFHDFLKRNEEFQSNTRKYTFAFPPGATWLCFTDVVPHSVQSGQYALEQTFIVSRNSLSNPENAPIAILERLCGRKLA